MGPELTCLITSRSLTGATLIRFHQRKKKNIPAEIEKFDAE